MGIDATGGKKKFPIGIAGLTPDARFRSGPPPAFSTDANHERKLDGEGGEIAFPPDISATGPWQKRLPRLTELNISTRGPGYRRYAPKNRIQLKYVREPLDGKRSYLSIIYNVLWQGFLHYDRNLARNTKEQRMRSCGIVLTNRPTSQDTRCCFVPIYGTCRYRSGGNRNKRIHFPSHMADF